MHRDRSVFNFNAEIRPLRCVEAVCADSRQNTLARQFIRLHHDVRTRLVTRVVVRIVRRHARQIVPQKRHFVEKHTGIRTAVPRQARSSVVNLTPVNAVQLCDLRSAIQRPCGMCQDCNAVHVMDFIDDLLRGKPRRAFCKRRRFLHADADDMVNALLHSTAHVEFRAV